MLKAENQLVSFINYSPSAMALFDRHMNYLAASRRWLEDYQLEYKKILGRSHYEVFHHISDDWKALHKRALQGESLSSAEDRFTADDGSIVWLRWEIGPWKDSDGSIAGIVMMTENITKEKHLSNLAQSVQRMGKIGGWELDINSMKSSWTDETYRIHDLPVGGVIHLEKAIEFYAPHEREKIRSLVQQAISKGISFDEEFEFIAASGNHKWVRSIGIPIQNEKGKVLCLRGTFQDISDRKNLELHLIEANKLLCLKSDQIENLVRNSPGMIYQFQVKAASEISFPFVSSQVLDIFGITTENLVEDPQIILKMIYEVDLQGLYTLIHQSEKTMTSFKWIGRVVTSKREIKWISAVSSPRRLSDDQLIWDGIMVDISEEIRLQKNLEQAEKLGKMGNWLAFTESKNVYWSDQMYEFFPVKREENVPSFKRLLSFVHRDDRSLLQKIAISALRTGQEFMVYCRVHHPHRMLWLECRGRGLLDGRGKVIEIFGTCQDVTDRQELENELKRSKNLLMSSLDHMPGPIYTKDRDGRYLYVNEPFEKVTGKNLRDIYGKTDLEVYDEKTAKSLMANDRMVLEKKQVLRLEETVPHPDGSLRKYDSYKFPVLDGNSEIFCVTGVSLDITDKIAMEKELEVERSKSIQSSKLASLGEMSAGIAHEINNPLAVISGAASLLPKVLSNPEKLSKYSESIIFASERISKIVNGLKKFARTSESAEHSSHSVGQIVEEAIVLTSARAKRAGVEVRYREASKECHIQCDEVGISQVVVNLINNAVYAVQSLPEKWVDIEVESLSERVLIRVTDSGKGIDQELQPKLFQPFFTTKPVGEGTGLGLSISKGILDDHHAKLVLKEDSAHTCFEISFKKDEKINVA